ncbi:hypothetical protein [Nocardia gamkensis]|uniref:Uncharacterized protein n=1 Tax=Nocardia gamkensis TaxID=352869 RepID=A0A7X6L9Z6_9NOCA|nr:hypothetical protein [Nocardia gamkensis]NKY30588.1 hypothetical protein [Nocardia gamkensis]
MNDTAKETRRPGTPTGSRGSPATLDRIAETASRERAVQLLARRERRHSFRQFRRDSEDADAGAAELDSVNTLVSAIFSSVSGAQSLPDG